MSEFTELARGILSHSHHLDGYTVKSEILTLCLQFIQDSGGKEAIDLFDQAVGRARN